MLATFPLTVKGLEALSPGFNFGNVILTLPSLTLSKGLEVVSTRLEICVLRASIETKLL